MKKITTLIIILLSLSSSYGQWVQQNSGVTETLNDVYCITPDFVVVVGNSGTILKTTDGGVNWIQKTSGTANHLMKVQFVNANIGYAYGTFETLLKTTDAGETWSAIATGVTSSSSALWCISENVFYMAGYNGTIKKTIDGGNTFSTLNTPATQSIEDIQFINEQIGFASNFDTIYRTIDGGNTWSIITEGFDSSFFFLNETIGFLYSNQSIFKTLDGGATLISLGYNEGQAQDLFALNENVVWEVNGFFALCGCPPSYCITKRNITETNESEAISNCGLSGNPDFLINAIYFANDTTGYAVGDVGYLHPMNPNGPLGGIFKNTTGTMLGVESNEIIENDVVKIYPNPASENFSIAFSKKPVQPYVIEITDYLGKQILSKSFETESTANVNVASISKGVYFLTIVNQEKRHTEKVIID